MIKNSWILWICTPALLMMGVANVLGIEVGKRNAEAPEKLQEFEFILGDWECNVNYMHDEQGNVRKLRGEWSARYQLNGYLIEEEINLFHLDGKAFQRSKVFRSVDPASNKWKIMWFDGMASKWLSLISDEFPSERTDSTLVFKCRNPEAPKGISKITFWKITKKSFRWKVEYSENDGKDWSDIPITFEAKRVE